jgi:hypothetical protein
MKPVVIESPWQGLQQAKAYLDSAIRFALECGLTPYASHGLLIGALDDDDPKQRALGLYAGQEMSDLLLDQGAQHWFFSDFGFSEGMQAAWLRHQTLGDSRKWLPPTILEIAMSAPGGAA